MKTHLIAAMCEGRGIGNKGSIPWHSPEDLRFFSRTTRGKGNNAVVMGMNTWRSIGEKPLSRRTNIILSRTAVDVPLAHVCASIEAVDHLCASANFDEVWIIGGAQIYSEYLRREKIDECYITQIQGTYECDTFFPQMGNEWTSFRFLSTDDFYVERWTTAQSMSKSGLS